MKKSFVCNLFSWAKSCLEVGPLSLINFVDWLDSCWGLVSVCLFVFCLVVTLVYSLYASGCRLSTLFLIYLLWVYLSKKKWNLNKVFENSKCSQEFENTFPIGQTTKFASKWFKTPSSKDSLYLFIFPSSIFLIFHFFNWLNKEDEEREVNTHKFTLVLNPQKVCHSYQARSDKRYLRLFT